MTVHQKIWGTTECEVETEFYSRHRLHCKAGSYCSIHYHLQRANRFRVVSGMINGVEMIGMTPTLHILGPDNTLNVPSLIVHQFQVVSRSEVVEEYFPDRGGVVSNDDIVRIVEGGEADDLDAEFFIHLIESHDIWKTSQSS